jgi:hypothetical protein
MGTAPGAPKDGPCACAVRSLRSLLPAPFAPFAHFRPLGPVPVQNQTFCPSLTDHDRFDCRYADRPYRSVGRRYTDQPTITDSSPTNGLVDDSFHMRQICLTVCLPSASIAGR